jgi:hypothetical protein
VALVLTLIQIKQIRIIYIKETIQKHSTNNKQHSKHSKYKYTYYQTPTQYKPHTYTHSHIKILKFLSCPINYLLADTQHYTLTTMELSRHKLWPLQLCAVFQLGQLFEYCMNSGRCTRLRVCCSNVTLNPGVWQLGIHYSSISMWEGNRLGAGFGSLQVLWFSCLFCVPAGSGAHVGCCTMSTGCCLPEWKPGVTTRIYLMSTYEWTELNLHVTTLICGMVLIEVNKLIINIFNNWISSFSGI